MGYINYAHGEAVSHTFAINLSESHFQRWDEETDKEFWLTNEYAFV